MYFLPAQTGLSGFCAVQTENPVVHSHLYDPTVLWQTELALQASEDRHSSTSVEVTKKIFHETWECYYKPRYRAILTLHTTLNRDCSLRITQNCFQLFFIAVSEVSKLIFREIPDFLSAKTNHYLQERSRLAYVYSLVYTQDCYVLFFCDLSAFLLVTSWDYTMLST